MPTLSGCRTTAQVHHGANIHSTPHSAPTPVLPSSQSTGDVSIVVDGNVKHQIMEGFGATTLSLVYGGFDTDGYDDKDNLSPALRARAIEAVYGQVKLTMGNLQLPLLEQGKNDDNDPFNFNWKGFDLRESRFMKEKVADLARPYGFDNYSLANTIDFRRTVWLMRLRTTDYNRYLDECAEHIAAGALNWRTINGSVPRTMFLFNEPLSGNSELKGGSTQEVVDIVKRAGARLRQGGLAIKFVVPNEETEEKSLQTATAILSDPEARSFVAAIGYHPYPYGSPYSFVPNILATSGHGTPPASRVAIREKLSELGHQYNVPLWMTEVSHSGVERDSIDELRGRAIHIHDELEYADAAAYFAMNAMWDTVTHQEHTGGSRAFSTEDDNVAAIDVAAGKVIITGMGYAIGHYARYIERGARRIGAKDNDPLVLTSAFSDEKHRRITLVVINNASENRRINVNLTNVPNVKELDIEQSFGTVRWQKLSPVTVVSNNFTWTLPAQSVTTLTGQF